MSTSRLKRSLELLESDHGKTCRKGKPGVNENSKKSKSQTKRKQGHQSSLWHTNSNRSKRNEIDDLTKDNLSVLKLLSSRHVDDDTANKILVRAGKKKIEEVVVLKDEKTAFSEEDFLDFEKEYFVSDK